ncbi:hypothetical protein CAPTEDRAFT_180933 [Capitella teleta]|uniref:TIR domain-containing protein n=1 Tax=Capitella teleta TaxID=283909 RepID=R7UGJ9_CAPTE|nr:hypothetical protein CAPTEDRAFT_180933 [Capitella teleta]|eukprot:ELU05218.1 hypothetical protein CAPTEDRAFT_180933 [Capitella teleta]
MLKRDSSVEEQMSAAKTLWVLSFDKEVAQNIREEEGIMELLEKLSKHDNVKLCKLCNGALWILKEKAGVREQEPASDEKAKEQHIFISYSWAQQEEVVKIKDLLKERGFQVWFDLEQMCGSTLEAMAAGIENSSVVLVCASEKYKVSPNCRTEAEYTFQLKKPIIPLMLQRHYRPDGWLGMMMGAKLYINFDGKYTFDHASMMLLKELQRLGNEQLIPTKSVPLSQAVKSEDVADAVSVPLVKSWTEAEILDWRGRHSLLDDRWTRLLGAFNGKRLHQLYKMSTTAPDFFYKYITESMHLELPEVLDLANALEEL